MLIFSRARSRFWSILFITVLILAPLLHTSSASADTMTLNPAIPVKVINTTTKSSEPIYLSTLGNQLLFSANEGLPENTFWTSDGTPAGTFRLKSIIPVSNVVVSGGIGFFRAKDSEHGLELWRTDGTANGTQLVKDINPGPTDGYPHELLDVNGVLYFIATAPNATGLWKSDGTAAGTVPIIPLSGEPRLLTKVQNRLFFVQGDSPADLWVSDGTAAGTQFVKQITAGQSVTSRAATMPPAPIDPPFDYDLTEFNNKLFFRASDDVNGSELWQSDGTAAGTTIVKGVKPGTLGSAPFYLTKLNGKLFFGTAEDGLWQTDGTTAGTTQVRGGIASVGNLYAVGSTLYFTAYTTEQGAELWRSDGTFAGTTIVKELSPGPLSSNLSNFTEFKGKLFFHAYGIGNINRLQLWQSDGTASGTMPVPNDHSEPYGGAMQVANGRIFFSAYDPLNGVELWSSDGADDEAILVRDINPQKMGSDSTYLTAVGNRIFFMATDNTSNYQVWTSDGTAEGTHAIEKLGTVRELSELRAKAVNNGLYLVLNHNQLWWIDGVTLTPTLLLESQNGTFPSLVGVDNQLFFLLSSEDEQERGLWQSDGTLAGTQRIKSVQTVYDTLISVNNRLYFSVYDTTFGHELWQSDGTEAGTMLLKDINPGPADSRPIGLTNVNGTIFFLADDGIHGGELWKSDGTAAGTVLVQDSFPGFLGSAMDQLTEVQDRLFFINSDSMPNNVELWVSDGTDAGTHLVKDIHPTDEGQTFTPSWLTAFNDKLLFVANDVVHGEELWSSDGTEAGTQLVRDINPGPADSTPYALTNVNGIVLFAAIDGSGQRTLWRSNGTEAGTQSIQAITPKPDIFNYRAASFVQAGNNIFFSADDGTTGRQLWKIPLMANGLLLDIPALVGAPAGGIGRIPVQFGNQSNTPQTNATLTVTLDERLTYLASTGPITPTITANTLIWSLSDLGVLSAGELDLRVQTPADPLGTRYPVTITLATGPAGSNAPSETSKTIEVMAADQNYLPVIGR